MEDRWLVYCCKRGSGDALRRVYEKYKRELLVLAVALLDDGHLAEDVLHDVFVAFVAGLSEFRLTGSLKGYLATCVANRAKNVRNLEWLSSVSFSRVDGTRSEQGGKNSDACMRRAQGYNE